MDSTEQLTLTNKNIGKHLLFLRYASLYPDNYYHPYVGWVKEKLSLELRSKARLYKEYPDLRPKTRTRQMRLPV